MYTGCNFSAERENKSHSGCVKWIGVDLVFPVDFQSEMGLYSGLLMLNALNWIIYLRGSTLQNVNFISVFQGYCFLDFFPEMSSAGSPRGWRLCHPFKLLVPSQVTPLLSSTTAPRMPARPAGDCCCLDNTTTTLCCSWGQDAINPKNLQSCADSFMQVRL